MSRGLGVFQKRLLAGLEKAGGTECQYKLQWKLAEDPEVGGVEETGYIGEGVRQGYLKQSFLNQFRKAIKSIPQIGTKSVKITSLDQLYQWYPYKTSKLEILILRKLLLHLIVEESKEVWDGPRFNLVDNENFYCDKLLREMPSDFSDMRKAWEPIEKDIIRLDFAQMNYGENATWFELILRCNKLFLPNKFRHVIINKSFQSIIAELRMPASSAEHSMHKLISKIDDFYDLYFPDETIAHLKIKNILYQAVSFPNRGAGMLKDEIKRRLYGREKELIISLDGHKEPEERYNWGRWGHITFSPHLDKIIEKHVFSPFHVLTLQ